MPRRKPAHAATSHLRRAIASGAARLIAEDGLTDYGAAKRKAARSLGASDSESLPTNEEIELELRSYQSLYQEDEHRERLRQLRQTALDFMRFMTSFPSRLTGPVLDGTAGRYSPIELQVLADSSKDVEIWLLSHSIPYETEEIRHKGPDAPETRLLLEWADETLALAVYQRTPHASNKGGRTRHYANVAAVEAILAEGDAAESRVL